VPDKKFYLEDILETLPSCKVMSKRNRPFVNISFDEAHKDLLILDKIWI